MSDDDAVLSLIDDAYAAALDPSAWPGWAVRAGAFLEGVCTSFYVVDRQQAAIVHQDISHPSLVVLERYVAEEIWRLDPQVGFVARNPCIRLFTDTDHLNLEDPGPAEYVKWQRSNAGIRHYMTANIPLGDGMVGGLSVHRHTDAGVTTARARTLMASMGENFGRALQLGFTHASRISAAYWDGLIATQAEPAILLDEQGRALRCTESVAALLSRRPGLDIVGGRLHARDAAADGLLQAAVGRSLARKNPEAGAARVPCGPLGASLIVSTFPLVRKVRHLAPAEAAALVTIVDPATAPPSREKVWREAFGLSARETELVALLAGGHSMESASAVMGVARNTARLHLARVFAKSGCTRQSELLQLLARLV